MKAGWGETLLGDVASLSKTRGGSRPLPYVGLEDISSGGGGRFVGSFEPQSDKSSTFEFGPEHLLYGRLRPYLNKVLLPEFEGHCSSEIFPILPSPRLDRRFLFYWITRDQTVQAIDATCTGARMPRANVSELLTFPIPLPPLDEQRRIVAVLDEAFEGLARARANAEANLQSAQELFERYLSDQFLHGGLGNKTCTVGDLITLQRGFDITKKDQRDGPFPVVSSGGAKSHHDTAMSKAPGVVIGRKGSIGSVYFVDEDFWPHDTTLWVKDFKGNDPRLIYYLMRGINLVELDTGAANPSLNRNLVHPLLISWPDEGDQTKISGQISEVEEQTLELEKQYSHKLHELDDLRQAILQKAFAGELT